MKKYCYIGIGSLALMLVGAVQAGEWSHYISGSPGYYSGTADIPAAATCHQQGAPFPGYWSSTYVYNSGPLGAYTGTFDVRGSIDAGSYQIVQQVGSPYGEGYTFTEIDW